MLGIEDEVPVVTIQREDDDFGRTLEQAAQEAAVHKVVVFMSAHDALAPACRAPSAARALCGIPSRQIPG
jgi:hypothetical protein